MQVCSASATSTYCDRAQHEGSWRTDGFQGPWENLKAHSRSPSRMPSWNDSDLQSFPSLLKGAWTKVPVHPQRLWKPSSIQDVVVDLHRASFSGAILQGQHARRSPPTRDQSAHVFTILLLLLLLLLLLFFFFFFFSVSPFLIAVYFNLESILHMCHRRHWEVSNSIPSLELDQAGRKGEG